MNTGFRVLHPVTTLLFYIFIFTLSLTATHPAVLAAVMLTGIAYDIKNRGKKALSFIVKIILPLVLIAALINGLFNHEGSTVLFTLPGGYNFTLEAIIYGLIFALRSGSMLIWLFSFNDTLTGDKISFLFGRFSPKIALIISMALRFIPLIMLQGEEVNKASRGIGEGDAAKSPVKRLKGAAERISVLVSWSLERGIDTQNSMLARGYGLKGRTVYSPYIFGIKDILILIFTLVCFALIVISKNTLRAIYMPGIIIPFPGIRDIAVILAFAALLLAPLIIDVREEKKWSIS